MDPTENSAKFNQSDELGLTLCEPFRDDEFLADESFCENLLTRSNI